jgi:hypothetical protein
MGASFQVQPPAQAPWHEEHRPILAWLITQLKADSIKMRERFNGPWTVLLLMGPGQWLRVLGLVRFRYSCFFCALFCFVLLDRRCESFINGDLTAQLIFYGYGTGWAWYYWPTFVVQSLASPYMLFSLRYSLDEWNSFIAVKIFNVIMPMSVYADFFLPLPGFLFPHLLYMVPFRSPTNTTVYYFVSVRTSFEHKKSRRPHVHMSMWAAHDV